MSLEKHHVRRKRQKVYKPTTLDKEISVERTKAMSLEKHLYQQKDRKSLQAYNAG